MEGAGRESVKTVVDKVRIWKGKKAAYPRGGEPELCGLPDGVEEYAFREYGLPQAVEM